MADRVNNPHPRAPISDRLSVEEYRALMGRSSTGPAGTRKARTTRNRFKAIVDAKRALQGSKEEKSFSTLPLVFSLPFLPPSVNALFHSVTDNATGRPKRVLTAKARRIRDAIGQFVSGDLSTEAIYELHITVEMSLVTKAGNIRKVDVTNRVKFIEDCISRCLGIDDSQFFRVVLNKLHADHERTVVKVLPYTPQQNAA